MYADAGFGKGQRWDRLSTEPANTIKVGKYLSTSLQNPTMDHGGMKVAWLKFVVCTHSCNADGAFSLFYSYCGLTTNTYQITLQFAR